MARSPSLSLSESEDGNDSDAQTKAAVAHTLQQSKGKGKAYHKKWREKVYLKNPAQGEDDPDQLDEIIPELLEKEGGEKTISTLYHRMVSYNSIFYKRVSVADFVFACEHLHQEDKIQMRGDMLYLVPDPVG